MKPRNTSDLLLRGSSLILGTLSTWMAFSALGLSRYLHFLSSSKWQIPSYDQVFPGVFFCLVAPLLYWLLVKRPKIWLQLVVVFVCGLATVVVSLMVVSLLYRLQQPHPVPESTLSLQEIRFFFMLAIFPFMGWLYGLVYWLCLQGSYHLLARTILLQAHSRADSSDWPSEGSEV